MDHHGIVAGICKELNIADKINARIGSKDPRRIVQAGTAVVAMIINALGFTNRRLYLTPQFFQSKAVEQLLGDNITADNLDDHSLGKSLDEASAYGVTKLYGEIAFEIATENKLLGKKAHLDTTSFSLSGSYEDAINDYRIAIIDDKITNKALPKNIDIAITKDRAILYYTNTDNKFKTVTDISKWWPELQELLIVATQNIEAMQATLQDFFIKNRDAAVTHKIRISPNKTIDCINESQTVQVHYGHSKDHRSDLKQVMLSLSVTGDANIPIWMEPQDGNSSDKTSFHETITRVEDFKKQLQLNHDFIWIADSALYTPEKLLKQNDILWASRVPESIKECKELLQLDDEIFTWVSNSEHDGYKCTEVGTSYGGIKQRWIIVSSEQAYLREKITFDKKLQQQMEQMEKDCWHFSNEIFNCVTDAKNAALEIQKNYKFFIIESQVEAVTKNIKKGRPSKKATDADKMITGYQLTFKFDKNMETIKKQLRTKGRFIIATNDILTETAPFDILTQYKEQQGVESGFKFLKDPWFMVDSFFVKKASRVAALMMIMTLSLLVYNFAQHKLRTALKKQNTTIPNQLGKQIQNPTMRWVFQIMEGIGIIKVYDKITNTISAMITNLNDMRLKIIRLLGGTICEMYGI